MWSEVGIRTPRCVTPKVEEAESSLTRLRNGSDGPPWTRSEAGREDPKQAIPEVSEAAPMHPGLLAGDIGPKWLKSNGSNSGSAFTALKMGREASKRARSRKDTLKPMST